MTQFFKLLFLSTMVMGTLVAVSSYSWLSMWMGLEINLLSIIPILSNSKSMLSSESALKYFITQAMASSILLFSIIMMMNSNDFLPQNFNYLFSMIMNSALLTKVGAAPFHIWFPEVMEGLSWMNCLIMLTWQKVAPMIILMYNSKMITFLSLIIIISSLIGGIMGINQISLRKIMAYSSINHIGWMIASMVSSINIWTIYFLIYSLISINIILIFNKLNIFFLKQMFSSSNPNKTMKFFLIMNFLSLGGLPPFLGFLPKWLTVNNLVINNFFFLSSCLIILTLITLFFYLRMTFTSMIMNSSESIISNNKKTLSFPVTALNFISLSGLTLSPLIISLI
uniref:NADH-ubiquinone oxidoreductase chain 2 n=1 Tax=Aromia bungii TaxID=320466 RepID=A0A7M1I7E7_9CUCU|nr:NADH dehydrogenase subunit 2 [Aromia bungii]QOQ34999.1 NADH dehydrogenase subunit 2 [Aromia bungii]UZA66528.1 NADH dehydrogenase subunit 2 [Aromia bungii]